MRPQDPSDVIPFDPAPDAPTPLDRVWAATRPAAPPPEVLDALWAHAARELDRIGAGGPTGSVPSRVGWSRRRRVVVGVVLAQAAAVLLAVGVARRPRVAVESPAPPATTAAAPVPVREAARPMLDVGVEQTLVVRIDDDGQRVDILPEPLLASNTLADDSARDLFNALESGATP